LLKEKGTEKKIHGGLPDAGYSKTKPEKREKISQFKAKGGRHRVYPKMATPTSVQKYIRKDLEDKWMGGISDRKGK